MQSLFAALGRFWWWLRSRNPATEGYAPYSNKDSNALYNLAFCDKPLVLRKRLGSQPEGVWATLIAEPPYIAALVAIANDPAQESAARSFAFSRLRELKQPVPEKLLLGTVIEVRMPEGLDTLAVYADGRVRYLHHSGKASAFEPVPSGWMPKVRRLMNASQAAVERTGPWEQLRLAPPDKGAIRMSFLVSDGLYFGQGPMGVMERDALAQPIIAAGLDLLKLVSSENTRQSD
jgi:hypothetical protein